jgi:phosphoribosylglycinamide formyltransferase-1
MQKIKTAILISGRGSNMMALVEAAKNPDYLAEISLVIFNQQEDKNDSLGVEFAKKNGIRAVCINHKNFASRQDFDLEMSKAIDANNCQIICLAGFMRVLSPWFVNKYQDRVINIHPSLLPSFKGDKAVLDALNYGVKIAGCTTHFVTAQVDSGKIILQAAVKVLKDDDLGTLSARILKQEHIIYSQSLEIVCESYNKNSK